MDAADGLPVVAVDQEDAGADDVFEAGAGFFEDGGNEGEALVGLLGDVALVGPDGAGAGDHDVGADADGAGEADDGLVGGGAVKVCATHCGWDLLFRMLAIGVGRLVPEGGLEPPLPNG